MRTLYLSLKSAPFEVMVTGEKPDEYRVPSHWILSRIDGKIFDQVHFTNGYGPDKPWFTCQYKGFTRCAGITETKTYSNGLVVNIEPDTIIIHCGDIIERGNLKSTRV